MQLFKLLEGIEARYNPALDGMELSGICADSRKVKIGDLFICLHGREREFVAEAIKNGARAVVTERAEEGCDIEVDDVRAAYALISKNFYGKACDRLKVVGVTGTNGKTTTVNLIADILRSAGRRVAVVGTMGINFAGKNIETGFTTPDPDILHKAFRDMADEGVEFVIMEASAHAIKLKKLEGINFEIGVLTNITQDHLDFFKDMENYAETKLSFFDKNMKAGLVCRDDPLACRAFENPKIPLYSYSVSGEADVCAVKIDEGFDGASFVCRALGQIMQIKTNLVGKYNVANSLACIGACRLLGVASEDIEKGMRYCKPVEGRFNVIKRPQCNIVIDYAHTPDGFANVLSTVRELTEGRVIALFGCGGNRDKTKRPIMGRVASEYADKIILTSDNPRLENPLDIIRQIEVGVGVPYEIFENRRDAIAHALDECRQGDTLVIAGKGGEKYQDIGGQKIPYNDFDAVYKYFREHISTIKKEGNSQGKKAKSSEKKK